MLLSLVSSYFCSFCTFLIFWVIVNACMITHNIYDYFQKYKHRIIWLIQLDSCDLFSLVELHRRHLTDVSVRLLRLFFSLYVWNVPRAQKSDLKIIIISWIEWAEPAGKIPLHILNGLHHQEVVRASSYKHFLADTQDWIVSSSFYFCPGEDFRHVFQIT